MNDASTSPPQAPTTTPAVNSAAVLSDEYWLSTFSTRNVVLGTLLVALAVGLLYLLVALRDVIMLFFLGIVIATALSPIVNSLRRFGVRRDVTLIISFGIMIAAVVGIMAAILPFFITQSRAVVDEIPLIYRDTRKSLIDSSSGFLFFILEQTPADPFAAQAATAEQDTSQQALSMLGSVFNWTIATVLVLMLSYYWLYYRQHAIQGVALLIPAERRQAALELWEESEAKIGAFVRGMALLSILMAILSGIGFSLIGLPHALILAIMAGLLEAVPYVGPFILAIMAGIIGLGVSPQMALMAILVSSVLQFLEGNIVVPRVMDKAVGVHPIITLLSIGVFADLFGLLGALLAVPLAAIIQIIFEKLVFRAPSAEELVSVGRGRAALLRYRVRTLANDVRQRARLRSNSDSTTTRTKLESWLTRLDTVLGEEERSA